MKSGDADRYGLIVMTDAKTALVCAAGDGRLTEIQQEHQGLHINAHSGNLFDTAIDAAIASGHVHVVRYLLDQGAYTDANQLSDAYKALAAEWTSVRESIVCMLYERRAITKSSSHGPFDDPQQLNHFVFMNDLSVVKLLLKGGAQVNTIDRTTELPPLFLAILRKNQSMVRILLEAGASVDQRALKHATDCHAEPTSLMLAAASGDASSVKLLLQYGAPVHEVDSAGKTALVRATEKGDIASMTMLLTAGSPIDAQTQSGRTALMTAAHDLHGKDAVRLLLGHEAAVDLVDGDNWTAFMHAAVFGNVESLESLLDAGSDVNATSNSGETALIHLVGASIYYPWSAELAAEELPKLRLLLERGAAVDQVNSDGWTALMIAAYDGRAQAADCVELLLKHGASPAIQTVTGETVFTRATINCDDRSMKRLLDDGSPSDVRSDDSNSVNAARRDKLPTTTLAGARLGSVSSGDQSLRFRS